MQNFQNQKRFISNQDKEHEQKARQSQIIKNTLTMKINKQNKAMKNKTMNK